MTPWISAVLGFAGALLVGLVWQVIRVSIDVAHIEGEREVTCVAHGKALECIPPLKAKVERLDQRIEDYMSMLDRYLARALRDWPTHKERDVLMAKLALGKLTLPEVERLDELLVQDMKEANDPERVFKMGMARARLTWVKSKIESERHD